jgi:hypothetical protein
MRYLVSLAVLLGGNAPSALAEPERAPHELVVFDPSVTPDECHAYAAIPEDARDPMAFASQQALSFAACLLDTSVTRTDEPKALPGMVEELTNTSAPAMMVYLVALEHAPPSLQLRVAYQLGVANVALLTRARSSIAAPKPELAAHARYSKLRGMLEPLLVPVSRRAAASFVLVDKIARDMPELADDPVAAYMIRSARAMFGGLAPEAQVWAVAEFGKTGDDMDL